jgi:hypothetical protein
MMRAAWLLITLANLAILILNTQLDRVVARLLQVIEFLCPLLSLQLDSCFLNDSLLLWQPTVLYLFQQLEILAHVEVVSAFLLLECCELFLEILCLLLNLFDIHSFRGLVEKHESFRLQIGGQLKHRMVVAFLLVWVYQISQDGRILNRIAALVNEFVQG